MKKLITIGFVLLSMACFSQRVQQFGQHGLAKYIPLLQTDSIRSSHMDSVGTATGGCVFRDAATGLYKIAPCGTGSGGPDTLKVVQQGIGYTTIDVATPDTLLGKTFTVSNGLGGSVSSDSTRVFKLGGLLTQNTDITGAATYNLNLGTSGSRLLNLNVQADNGVSIVTNNGSGISLNSGTSTLTVGGGSGTNTIKGGIDLNTILTATDANTAASYNNSVVILPDITANRTIQLSTLVTGHIVILMNRNTTGNTWSPNGFTLKDAAGSTVSTLANSTTYILFFDGTNYIQIK